MFEQFVKIKIVIAQKFHAGRLAEESAIRGVSTHRFRKRIEIIGPVGEPGRRKHCL
jgi:hypothetical protein